MWHGDNREATSCIGFLTFCKWLEIVLGPYFVKSMILI
jgi:hypothetical protein